MLTGLPSTRGDCAAVHPKCYCGVFNYGGDRNYGYSIVCKDMGNITQVPQFKAVSTVYDALMIKKARLSTVQRGAFNGLKVKKILLERIGIKSVQPGAFYGVGELLEISVTSNQIDTIAADAFHDLKQLKTLKLRLNRLTKVHAAWWTQMPLLEELDLGYNSLANIPDDAFEGLNQLKELDMDDTSLTTVNAAWWRGMPSLETLWLRDNTFRLLADGAFNGLKQLKKLEIGSTQLLKLSAAWWREMPALEDLDMSYNWQVTFTDGVFSGMNQLKKLRLDGTTLTSVSATWWSDMPLLEELLLNQNYLANNIPDGAFNGLKQLKILSMFDNRLKSVSAAWWRNQNMPHLESLVIYQNPLECDCHLAWLRTMRTILRYNPRCASPPSVNGMSVVAYDISKCIIATTEPGNSFFVLISKLSYIYHTQPPVFYFA